MVSQKMYGFYWAILYVLLLLSVAAIAATQNQTCVLP